MRASMSHPMFPELNAHAGAAPLGGLMRRVSHLLESWREVRTRAVAMDELSHLSDNELADIGLSRSDIPNIFRPGFRSGR
jgi:uncharacterized protein YjiS (DUF1127 family)